MLVYRLPRTPSTPRINLWRKLRRLGVVQVVDGVVALPLDSRNREQLEWLADDVVDAGGGATIWVSETATAAQERALAGEMASGSRGVSGHRGRCRGRDCGWRGAATADIGAGSP